MLRQRLLHGLRDAGATFVHDGVMLYYETYGQAEPLLLVHGNGSSIGTLAAQIEHFKATNKVIAMDSRDQRRSARRRRDKSREAYS